MHQHVLLVVLLIVFLYMACHEGFISPSVLHFGRPPKYRNTGSYSYGGTNTVFKQIDETLPTIYIHDDLLVVPDSYSYNDYGLYTDVESKKLPDVPYMDRYNVVKNAVYQTVDMQGVV